MQPAIPCIGYGTVRHARSRPAAHAFDHRAFFLRLPLRTLSVRPWPFRLLARNGRGLFALNDADHGDGRPLIAWIDDVLGRAGIDDADGEVWLHTFPRVAGYVFNPVSFWFCERGDGRLRAVVCEVNNTFGERHAYLLAHDDGRAIAWGESLYARKAFRVSPFCRVEGDYRFRFVLTNRAPPRFVARIDYHDRGGAGPLLRTSISGALRPLTEARLALTFVGYPLFTLGVIARIHWHALRLWIKRVPFFSKPAAPLRDPTR
ncbi:MAG: DUF1365 domain-containing protein [Burkholderiaceae bacterium]|nr:DUF1365 domain-containing protein [Burkholderiaceae bacterium]